MSLLGSLSPQKVCFPTNVFWPRRESSFWRLCPEDLYSFAGLSSQLGLCCRLQLAGLPNPPKNVVPDDWEGPASWSPRRSPNSERRSAKVQKPSGLNLQKKWFPTRSKKTRWETHFLWTEGPQRHKARSETTTASLGPQNFKDLQDVICKKCGSRRIFKTPLCSIDSGNSAKQQFYKAQRWTK